jgi:hypothetical protein
MKKVLLTLLGIIVVVGILAGAGFTGYRIGYNHGATASVDGTVTFTPRLMPMHNFVQGFDPHNMPMHNFGKGNERGFNHGFGPGGFGMMGRGMRGGGIFSLLHIAVLGILIWFAYKLIKGSGWKLSLTRHAAEAPKAEPSAAEKTE